MACLEIKPPIGDNYLILEGTPYPKGHTFTGKIEWSCGEVKKEDIVDVELQKAGIQWGDAIKWVTNLMGIQQCPPCKARQLILNEAAKAGWIETIKKLKGTI